MLPGPELAMVTKRARGGAEGARCEDTREGAAPTAGTLVFNADTRCLGVVAECGLVTFGGLGVSMHATRA